MKRSPITGNAFPLNGEDYPPGGSRRHRFFTSHRFHAQRRKKNGIGARLLPATAVILIAAILLTQPIFANEALLRGPRQTVRVVPEAVAPFSGPQGVLERLASAPVLFYQRFMGPSWGPRCAYYPSCSLYALLALHKHGAVVGTIMTFDRLQHEADEAKYAPPILAGEEIKLYDPLVNNDYWWYSMPSAAVTPANADR